MVSLFNYQHLNYCATRNFNNLIMDKYFVTNEDDKKAVRALFNVNEEEVAKKINFLKEWTQKSPHLPLESKSDTFLNLMLLRAKFKEEIAKKNIESYFNHLGRYPEIFKKLSELIPSDETGIAVLLPKPTTSWERLAVLKLNPEKISKNKNPDIARCIAIAIATAMITFNIDYVASLRLILDFDCMTVDHILQLNINDLFKIISIYENILKMRVTGIEILNAPHLLSVILNIAKVVLKPKLFSRISVHNNLCSLYKNISKEYLPSDYGGEQKSINELIKIWDQIFIEYKPFLNRLQELVELGTKREENNIFGVQGSFKSLVID